MVEFNPQQFAQEATRELLEARQRYQIEAQREKVDGLREQVDARLAWLSSQIAQVRQNPDRFPSGTFGHDTMTLDDLLRTLADESARLAEAQAALHYGGEVLDKFDAVTISFEQEPPREAPVTAGQYL